MRAPPTTPCCGGVLFLQQLRTDHGERAAAQAAGLSLAILLVLAPLCVAALAALAASRDALLRGARAPPRPAPGPGAASAEDSEAATAAADRAAGPGSV